jgi:glycosyltransferase involved in cell wall biosynthesis
VIDGHDGLLVPPRDALALAAAIRRLLEDTSLRVQLGGRGRTRVEQEFSDAIVVNQTLAVYRGMAGL